MIQVTWKYSEPLVSFHDKRTLVGGDHRVRLPQTSVQPSSFCGIKVDLSSSRVQRTQRSPCGNSENICVLSFCSLPPHSLQFHKGPLRATPLVLREQRPGCRPGAPGAPAMDERVSESLPSEHVKASRSLSQETSTHASTIGAAQCLPAWALKSIFQSLLGLLPTFSQKN